MKHAGQRSTETTARLGLRERKKEKTRLALETAALALFAEKGFDGTTVDEIAEACDVSQRTFFRYYSTKEDVLFADGDERLESVLAEIAARPAGEQPIRTVQAAFLTLVEEYAHDRERLILRSKIFDGSSGLRSHKFEQQQNWEAEITAALVARDLQATRATPTLRLRVIAGASMACIRAALQEWIEEGGELATMVTDGFDVLADGLSVDDVERVPAST